MFQQVRSSKFSLGQVTVTADARALIPASEIARAISRHGQGDWGEVDEETKAENEGGMGYARLSICSRYRTHQGDIFHVMTLPERQQTLVMLGTLEESVAYS
jgi:hypothetical protein